MSFNLKFNLKFQIKKDQIQTKTSKFTFVWTPLQMSKSIFAFHFQTTALTLAPALAEGGPA